MAGNGIIGALLVSLGIDSAAFDTGLKEAEGKVSAFGKSMSSLAGIAMGGLVAGAAVAGAAFVKFGTESLSAADDIGDAAARLGITAEAYQKLGIAATAAGGTPALMAEAMDKLNENVGAFVQTGGGKAADAFKRLGIAGQITSGQLGTADQVFYAAVKAMEGIEDPALKARIAMQLFGKSAGSDMLEVTAKGADGLKALGDAAAASGRVMSSEMVDKLSDAKLTIDNTKTAFNQMATVMAGEGVVAIVDMAKELGPLWEQMKAIGSQVADYLMPSITELGGAFMTLARGPAGQWLLEVFREIGQLLGTAVVVAVNVTIKAFTALFKVVDAVGRFIADAVNKMSAGFEWLRRVTGGLINIIVPVAPAYKAMAKEVGEVQVPTMVNNVATQFNRLPGVMTKVAKAETDKTAKAFKAMKDSVNAVISSMFTPDEKAEKDFRDRMKSLHDGLAAGIIDQKEYDEQIKRAREDLNDSSYSPKAYELATDKGRDIDTNVPDYAKALADAVRDTRAQNQKVFSETFTDGIMAALNGDLGSFFSRWWQRSLTKDLDQLGSKLFDVLGNLSGSKTGISWSGIGDAISSIFRSSPAFANGGTVGIKGGGGTDSRLFSAWVSPDEIINIGKSEDLSGGAMTLRVEASPWFDVRAKEASQPMALDYARQAASTGVRGGAALAQTQAARRERSWMP